MCGKDDDDSKTIGSSRDMDDAKKDENKADEALKRAPLPRRTTDILVCLAFIGYIVTLFMIFGYAKQNGDPNKIITPLDADGNTCGAEGTDY